MTAKLSVWGAPGKGQEEAGGRGAQIYLLCWRDLLVLAENLLVLTERNSEGIAGQKKKPGCMLELLFPSWAGDANSTVWSSAEICCCYRAGYAILVLMILEVMSAWLCAIIFLDSYERDLKWHISTHDKSKNLLGSPSGVGTKVI